MDPKTDETAEPREWVQGEASVLDILVTISQNARLLVVGPLAAAGVLFGLTYLIDPTYTATTRILPPQQQQGSAGLLASQPGMLSGLVGGGALNIRNPVDTYVALLKSRTVADRLIDRFELVKRYEAKLRDDARRRLSGFTEVKAGKDGLISIDVDADDPKFAADMANAYVEELYRLTGKLALTEAQQRRQFFEKQLQLSQEGLRKAQVSLGEVGAGESLIKSVPQAIVEGIARLKAQLTSQEIRLANMQGSFTETSPEFRLAQRELASLRTQLSQAEINQPAKASQRGDYLNRYREYKYQEVLFELVAKQFEAARLDEAREGATIQVVDMAVPPERKSKPQRVLVAVVTGLATGFMLLMFVLGREAIRNARKEENSRGKLDKIASSIAGVFGR